MEPVTPPIARARPGLFAIPLVRELAAVLVVKLIVLYVIWLAFFSDPLAPQLTVDGVSAAVAGTAPISPDISTPRSTP